MGLVSKWMQREYSVSRLLGDLTVAEVVIPDLLYAQIATRLAPRGTVRGAVQA